MIAGTTTVATTTSLRMIMEIPKRSTCEDIVSEDYTTENAIITIIHIETIGMVDAMDMDVIPMDTSIKQFNS